MPRIAPAAAPRRTITPQAATSEAPAAPARRTRSIAPAPAAGSAPPPPRVGRTIARQAAPAKTAKAEPREIDATMAAINKRFGNQTVITADAQRQPWRIPTSIFSLDLALLGGIPHNRVTMFHGPRSSGKTTAAEKCIKGAQLSLPGQQAAFIDVEHTRDAEWGTKLGVNNQDLIYANPETGENAVDILDALMSSREISLIVLDSIAALVPMKEIAASAEDAHVGLQSRMVSAMTRKITASLLRERMRGHFVTVLVINQQRSKIGGWSPNGDPISLPGGKALEFTTSVQIGFKNKETSTKDSAGLEMLDFNEHTFTIDKCKMHAGMRKGEYRLMRRDDDTYGLLEGDIDDAATMLAHAKRVGCFSGGGKSWTVEVPGFRRTFGKTDEAIVHLYESPEDYTHLRNHLLADHAVRLKMPQYYVDYLYGD